VASRTITMLTDDIDGGDAVETVTFAFKGGQYEIDLSQKNVDKMVKALQPYTHPHRQPWCRQGAAGQDPRVGSRQRAPGLRPWSHQCRRPRRLPRRELIARSHLEPPAPL